MTPQQEQFMGTDWQAIVPRCFDHSIWLSPPAHPRARHDEVHVWRVSLDESQAPKFEALLDDDERMRAARFRFQEHRNRFIVARGALRTILGSYLQTEPAELQFSYGRYGKPALTGGFAANAISFNLSHSGKFMLMAVSRGRELGIDLEWINQEFATSEVAERFFSHREILSLRGQPEYLQTEAFFNCWTRKEAYIKARGEGLTLPLDQFDVSLEPSGASLLDNRTEPGEVSRWSLQELHPAPAYCAAVAVEGFSWQLRLLDFNSSTLVVDA
ncbi:MAG: 4'-phosphopantetheinyl transferase superfamily protein [Acidobacteriota bacterium]|nr:4'-phosphopantetheinyl transferase superfamily protein [Acidobacteriota bacterium]